MDLEEFRVILSNSNLDVWSVIDAAIAFAAAEFGDELKSRRDAIVERLYSSSSLSCRNCGVADPHRTADGRGSTGTSRERPTAPIAEDHGGESEGSPSSPESNRKDDGDEQQDLDPYGGLFDDEDEQSKVLRIKRELEDPHQSEESLVELLQGLVDLDLPFEALQETDIGRDVSRLRKHQSVAVQTLAKQIVRKWKEMVDEWVNLKQCGAESSTLNADGDLPKHGKPKNLQNGHHKVPDYEYSPNPHSSENYNSEPEQKPKMVPRREPSNKQAHPPYIPAPLPPSHKSTRDVSIDLEKLNSARKRLQENYQEAQNAKKQRTVQVMDIHEIPKPRNGFIARNKGGFQGRNHR